MLCCVVLCHWPCRDMVADSEQEQMSSSWAYGQGEGTRDSSEGVGRALVARGTSLCVIMACGSMQSGPGEFSLPAMTAAEAGRVRDSGSGYFGTPISSCLA